MNSADLDRLGKLMEEGAVPDWLRAYIEQHHDEMVRRLNAGESISVPAPDGKVIVIKLAHQPTAA